VTFVKVVKIEENLGDREKSLVEISDFLSEVKNAIENQSD